MMHASQTDLGGAADIRLNDLLMYVLYQAATKELKPSSPEKESILRDLSLKPRSRTALETTEDILDVYLDRPVLEWEDALWGMDVPTLTIGSLMSCLPTKMRQKQQDLCLIFLSSILFSRIPKPRTNKHYAVLSGACGMIGTGFAVILEPDLMDAVVDILLNSISL